MLKMPQNDTLRIYFAAYFVLVSLNLLSEGDCISFVDLQVGFMTELLVSSLEDYFLQYCFFVVVVVPNDII